MLPKMRLDLSFNNLEDRGFLEAFSWSRQSLVSLLYTNSLDLPSFDCSFAKTWTNIDFGSANGATIVQHENAGGTEKRSRKTVADIVGEIVGPAVVFDRSTAFSSVGFNSMMGVTFRNRLAENFDISLPISLVLDYPTVGQVEDLVASLVADPTTATAAGTFNGERLQNTGPPAGSSTALLSTKSSSSSRGAAPVFSYASRDFRVLWGGGSDVAACKLEVFIFPCLGFGDKSFLKWARGFGDDVRVVYLGYSFGQSLAYQSEIERLAAVVLERCSSAVGPGKRPVLLYGHSLGGIVAYHVMQQVLSSPEAQGVLMRLAISSVPKPSDFLWVKHLHPFAKMRDFGNQGQILDLLRDGKMLPPGDLIEWSTVPEAVIVEDARFIATHSLKCGRLGRVPVIAIHAQSDAIVQSKHVEAWKGMTDGRFAFETIQGTHYFFIDPPAQVFQLLREFATQGGDEEKEDKPEDKCIIS